MTRVGGGSASAALAVAAVALGTVAVGLGPLSVVGVALFALGAWAGLRALLTTGAAAVGAAVLLSGVPVLRALVGAVAVALAWDVGHNAIGVAEQVGDSAATRPAEIVHAAASLVVLTGAAGVAYGVYRATAGGRPVIVLVALLVASALLAAAVGSDD